MVVLTTLREREKEKREKKQTLWLNSPCKNSNGTHIGWKISEDSTCNTDNTTLCHQPFTKKTEIALKLLSAHVVRTNNPFQTSPRDSHSRQHSSLVFIKSVVFENIRTLHELSLSVFTLGSTAPITPSLVSSRYNFDPVRVRDRFRCWCVRSSAHLFLICFVNWALGTKALPEPEDSHSAFDYQHVLSLLPVSFSRVVCIGEVWKYNIYPAPRAGLQLSTSAGTAWSVTSLRLCSCCHCLILSSEIFLWIFRFK